MTFDEPDILRERPILVRWWAAALVALVVAIGVSAAGYAAGLPYPATAALVGVVAAVATGGMHLFARHRRDRHDDLTVLREGVLEPTAPSAVAVLGVGLFVVDQFSAAAIATLQTVGPDVTVLAVLSSYVVPCVAAFGLAMAASRFSDRPFVAVLAGAGVAVLLDTVVLIVALGIPLSQVGTVLTLVVGYWTVRGALFLLGGTAAVAITQQSRQRFIARRADRLAASLEAGPWRGPGAGPGDVGGRP